MYPIEIIPNADSLYYRIHKSYIVDGEVTPGVFREIEDGMSTDWSKYSTPQESFNRCRIPDDNAIVSGNVGQTRAIPLNVTHAPTDNRAHTNVTGVNTKARLLLLEVFNNKEVVGKNVQIK